MDTAAARLGRRCLTIQGLAAYAFQQGHVVTTGGILDQCVGLQAAWERALALAPSILHVEAFDGECLDADRAVRFLALLRDAMEALPPHPQRLPNLVPSVVVVLSTLEALPPGSPIQLDYPSQRIPDPTPEYLEDVWGSQPVPENLEALMKGRPMHLVRYLRDQYQRSPDTRLQDLCEAMDRQRRTRGHIPSVHWEDIGGLSHVRKAIVEALELPLQYPLLDASGILLFGPPGTGKTMVAKAVATECGLPFLSIKGPELLGAYVGESEANVRDTFAKAKLLAAQNQPPACVLFFDELDSLAPRRGDNSSGGHVMDRVVATLFTELDARGSTVFCIGATNRPDLLDPALLRHGRLDRQLYLGVTDEDRVRILKAQLRRFKVDGDLESIVSQVVRQLPGGLTGADLSSIASGALIRATERLCRQADDEVDEVMGLEDVLQSWDTEKLQPLVSLNDLLESAHDVVPSVSAQDMKHYESLRERFRA